MLWTVLIGGHKRQVDGSLSHGRELDLPLFGGLGQALQRLSIAREIDALIFFELRDEPVDDALILVVAAEMRVAVGGLDFEDSIADFKDGDVERAAAEIPDENGLVA